MKFVVEVGYGGMTIRKKMMYVEFYRVVIAAYYLKITINNDILSIK